MEKEEESKFQGFLNAAYDISINGAPSIGIKSSQEMAECYMKGNGPLDKRIDSLIRFQTTKASTAGFVTGLGGLITIPLTLPANIASVLFVQINMIAAIAIMTGHDLKDDRVRTLCYVCLVGNAAEEVLRKVGIQIGKKLAEAQLKKLSSELIIKVNQRVGFRLLTKFGEKGAINLGKAVPLVGGVVGGAFDGTTTYLVGKTAKKIFLNI